MDVHSRFVPVERRGDIPEIGVGILGYGFMGRAHTNAYRTIPYIFWPPAARPRLIAMCGRKANRVAEAASRYGYEGYYTDWHDMLEDERIQLFDNSSSHHMHSEPSIAALRAGKHVICEKPLAMNAADALRMLQAARESGKKHLCSFNYRFVPAVRLARDLLASGLLGRVYQFRCRYLQESHHDPSQPLASLPEGDSRLAGALLVIGSHAIDQARFLVGEPATVSAQVRRFISERPIEGGGRTTVEWDDAISALIDFENGATGTIEASRVATGRKNQLAWEINGERGSLAFDLERLNELQVYLAGGTNQIKELVGFQDVLVTEATHPFARVWWPRGHVVGWEHAHINQLHHLLEAIALDKPVAPYGATFEDGYRAAAISEAILESARTGRTVGLRYED